MEDFDLTLSLNSKQIPVRIHPHIENDTTYYDLVFEDYTLSIYKDTLYTWTSDDSNGLSQADIQSIGEQIQDV
jgi:hypothetical protein